MNSKPIGVYDSGLGGLTVLKVLQKKFPHENFIYFADTANLPYGNKSPEQITQFSHEIITYLQNTLGVKLVVAACHTSSALALEKISQHFRVPIIGTIYPLLKNILNNNQHQRIGIIATEASANSRTHEKIFRHHGFQGQIFSIACPHFVPWIEDLQPDHAEIEQHAKNYLSIFHEEKLDTLIYGCTHYPFLQPLIENILPKTMLYLDPAEQMAHEISELLQAQHLKNHNTAPGRTEFYCSQDPVSFAKKIHRLLGMTVSVMLKTLI